MYKAITTSLYELMLQAYREAPANYAHAMRKSAAGREMVKRAWLRGWTDKYTWARPIQTVLEEERESARTAQTRAEQAKADEASEERAAARNDAVMSLAQEGRMLSAGRASVLASLASFTQGLPAVKRLVELIRDAVLAGQITDPQSAMRLLRDFSLCVKHLVEATDKLIEGERRHKGEPSQVIGLDVDIATVEESIQGLDHVSNLWELAKRRGLPMPGDRKGGPEGGSSDGNGGVH